VILLLSPVINQVRSGQAGTLVPTAPRVALASKGWTNITGTSPVPTSLIDPAVAEGGDGRIYLFGGLSSCCTTLYNTTYIFDPASGQWTQGTPMPTARWIAQSVTLPDGRIIVVGGEDSNNGFVNAVEIYTPATNSWTVASPLQTAQSGAAVALGGDGRVYAIGGQSPSGCGITEAYATTTNAWTYVAPEPSCALWGTAVADAQGDLVATAANTSAAFMYHIASNTWTSLASLPCCVAPSGATMGTDGRLYFADGNATEVYAPATNTWTFFAAPPTPWLNALLPAPSGQFYAVGDNRLSNVYAQIYEGTPVPIPYAETSTLSLDFGSVPISTTSVPQTITVTSVGTLPLTISGVSINTVSLLPPPPFRPPTEISNPANFATTGNTCTGASLAYGVSCAVSVTFTPTSTVLNGAELLITDNASSYPYAVLMDGAGVVVPPTLVLNRTTTTVLQSLTVTGTNFLGGEPVKLYWDSTATPAVVTATATISGSFTTLFTVPQAISGTHMLLAMGQTSGITATASVRIVPFVAVVPTTGAAGTTAHAVGVGFGAAEHVALVWDTPQTALGAATSNALGTFGASPPLTITVPAGAAAGGHLLYAIDQTSHAVVGRGAFTVRLPPSPTPTPTILPSVTPTPSATPSSAPAAYLHVGDVFVGSLMARSITTARPASSLRS
jgi:hypothetical protein